MMDMAGIYSYDEAMPLGRGGGEHKAYGRSE